MRKIESTVDLLEALKEAHGWPSDNAIARGLKLPQQTVQSYRSGARSPSDDHALLIARALGISPALVLAIAAAERSSSDAHRRTWRQVIGGLATPCCDRRASA